MRRHVLVVSALVLVSVVAYWRVVCWSVRLEGDATEATVPAAQQQHASAIDVFPSKSKTSALALFQGQTQVFHDPIVLGPCNLSAIAEQDVSSQIEGVFDAVLVELGQRVSAGQLLGRLDDRQVRPDVDSLRIKASSRAAELVAKALYDEAEGKVKYAHSANEPGLKAVSDLELQTYLAQQQRYSQEIVKAREEQQAAACELEKAERLLALHEIRTALAGTVIKVAKRNGEAVKQGEALFRVAVHHRLRVEGLCKVGLANQLHVGMPALVEPAIRGEPVTSLTGHTAEVHNLAVSGDGRLLASASADRSVILWRWPEAALHTRLPHPCEVHAVAFAPLKVINARQHGYQMVTAGADAMARLWRITPDGAVEGPVVLPRVHDGVIRAVAFSPDGLLCVTAGDDRRIAVWDVAQAKFLYWVKGSADSTMPAHQGTVTAVSFLPNGDLLSVARDNTLKVWKLGPSGAQLIGTQSGRTGDVCQLGTTPDGERVLFDHGEDLWILRRDNWTLAGRIQSRQNGHFQGVSLFSQSGKLLLTTSSNGRIQLWQTPASPEAAAWLRHGYSHGFHRGTLSGLGLLLPGGLAPLQAALTPSLLPRLWSLDAAEIRHFLVPNSTVQCAVFAPNELIIFTAGSDKVIRAWPVPTAAQWAVPYEASVTYIGGQVERGTDMVRIRAELDNAADPARQLMPGMFATLRLYPETATLPQK